MECFGKEPLSWFYQPAHHRRLRWQQWGSCATVEARASANETGLVITVAHHPPGTSKWNRIEHRLFAFITQNWRGKPPVSHEVIVQLIGATTTANGLDVQCCLDENDYPKAIKISDAEMNAINIDRDPFHGVWNYPILPTSAESDNAIAKSIADDR
ncbi:Rhodopirellula transposase DDE domain-containing protein [Rhizobium lusitanum]|uniref:Rhodopirellula transposase DDE domain-containing protein n=1 Tax=Rhizobium lusitanum TaxID=293958 RepID=A0A1C3X0C8_9HYPH|nr:Rhodopirellula transposase DDE domain-containing protein [Rhizobium lusitanum]